MRKRWLTILMSCLLVTSTAFTSLAAGSLNGGGSGSSQQISTIEYIASMHAYQINNGIQCSIVRKDNGQLVSNIVTMNNYIPTQIASAPEGDVKKYWNQYINRTGILNLKKENIMFLNGAKTDGKYAYSVVDLNNPETNTGVQYVNRTTGNVEPGKMYTYADIEYALNLKLAKEYGTSPIDPAGGEYNGVSKKFKGPVTRENGHNIATGDTFRDQMNTELPDGSRVLQHFLDLRITKADGLGNFTDEVEQLFHFTDPSLQARYEELINQGVKMPIIQVMIENNLYAEFEDIAWQVNEVVNPEAPEGYNRTGLTNENFWNSLVIYYGTPRLITYRTGRDLVFYLNHYKNYTRAKDPNPTAFEEYLEQAKNEIGPVQSQHMDENTWISGLLAWAKKTNISQAWDWSLAYQAFTLEKSEPQMGLKTFADLGIDASTVDKTIAGQYSFWLEHFDDLGYGVMLFSPVPEGATSTFDEINYSSTSKDGYRPGPSEDKYNDGGKEAQNNIVKFYATKQGDSYVYTENHTRKNTLGDITLENEEGYKIDSWFTSDTFKEPVSQTDSYDDWKASLENKQTGDKLGNVKLDQKQTLYLRLVEAPVVIKVYETDGNVDKVVTDNNPKFEGDKLVVTTPDNGYEYTEGVKSDTKKTVKSWNDVPDRSNTTETLIKLSPSEKVVYLHYTKDSNKSGLVLHENEISHQFNLSAVNGGTLVDGIRKYSSVSASGSCPEDVGDDEDPERCGNPYEYVGSDNWTFKIENKAVYNTQFIWKWLQTDQKSYSGNGLTESGGEGHSTPNMDMVIQRSISDKATLYPNLNSEESTLMEMGLQAPSYTPAGQRKDNASNQETRKTWEENFSTDWTFTEHNNPTAHFETDHGYTKTDTHSNTGNEAELNGIYSQAGNTTVYGLWGKNNVGGQRVTETGSNDKWTLGELGGQLRFTGLKSHIKESALKFYPYYRMKYVTELGGAEKDAYLTSENLSTMFSLQRVDTAMFKSASGNTLDLESTQWSMHSKAMSLLEQYKVEDKNSLLPAGAIYTLSSAGVDSSASPIWIGYRIFNTYVPDKSKLADSTDIKNRDEVLNTINNFKTETDRVVEGLEVAMYGRTGIHPEYTDTKFWENSNQITGKDGKYTIGKQKFDNDAKYDLKTGIEGANSSDIKILERRDEQYDWILEADADGNITISRNGQVLEVLSKNNKTPSVTEVVEFNSRTQMVSNFVNALDRNLGTTRTGESWYNEGFTVGCIEDRYALRVGFGDNGLQVRSAALNIKANGLLTDRRDLFNGAESTINDKARTYQFFTAPKSTVPEAASHAAGWIGTYDGKIDVQLPNIHLLLCSKRMYTSNTTVQDGN